MYDSSVQTLFITIFLRYNISKKMEGARGTCHERIYHERLHKICYCS